MPQLRDYQLRDKNFLKSLDQGACFNQQRTGKTPTILTVLKERNIPRTLILAPSSMLYVWQDEYQLWVKQPCQVYAGTAKQREEAIKNWTSGMVISYDLFKRGDYPLMFKKLAPDCIVLDEAHRIRNRKTDTAKAVFIMKNTPIKYVLTGTPSVNRGEDIWSILHFLFPKTYRGYWNFIEEHFDSQTVERIHWNRPAVKYVDILGYKAGHEVILQNLLNEFATNSKRKDVLDWNTEKEIVPVRLPLTAAQKEHLKNLKEYYETEDLVVKTDLERLIRYRQICLDPALLDLKSTGSPKLDWVKQFIRDYPEKPIILFSNFTQYIKKIQKEIPNSLVIIGETRADLRKARIAKFQKGESNVIILNTKAGREGITLDRADTTIFLDEFPPWGEQDQAEDRFLPVTMQRAEGKTNTIYKLIMRDSYEEQIRRLLIQRRDKTAVINDFAKFIGG